MAVFQRLIDTDDLLLATSSVLRLITFLGNEDPTTVRPTVGRMLASNEPEVREAGGQLAALAAVEWRESDHLRVVLDGADAAARTGAARLCAHRLPHTSNVETTAATLTALVVDDDPGVRAATAEVAAALRGVGLRPFEQLLRALIASPAFTDAIAQLLITLEAAPDRVDDLVLLCAERFVAVYGLDAGDLRTAAAGDAREVGELVIRGIAQSTSRTKRAALLDVVDGLLQAGAFGIDELISQSER